MGTGASAGVPVIGCTCSVCLSDDPKNHRLRTSCLVQVDDKAIIIDVGPDFRQQALRYGITKLDGLIVTHTHYDHIAGLDELRIFNFRQKKSVPCLLSKESHADLQERYQYIFRDSKSVSVAIDAQLFSSASGHESFCNLLLQHVTYTQVGMKVKGLRFGDLAFISDIKEYDKTELVKWMNGVKTAIIGAIRPKPPSHAHLSFEEAIELGQLLACETIYLTHLSHDVDYNKMKLPPNVKLAYDGLQIPFEACKV